jgi:hypothetical protein
MKKQENWKKIVINGIETFYSVSDLGRIRNDSTGTFLKGSISKNGYRMVHLRYRVDKVCSVHRLVAKAFKPCKDMDILQINHIDGNKLNNAVDNLEWSTALENMRHSFEMGLQPNKMRECHQYTLEGDYIQSFANSREAAKVLGLDASNIYRCVTEQQFIYAGFQFKEYKAKKIPAWTNPRKKSVFLYTDKGEFIKSYSSQKECAKDLGIAESSVSRYIKGTRTLEGFVFSRIPL